MNEPVFCKNCKWCGKVPWWWWFGGERDDYRECSSPKVAERWDSYGGTRKRNFVSVFNYLNKCPLFESKEKKP